MNKHNFEIDILKAKKSVEAGDWVVIGYAMTSDLDADHALITQEAIKGAKDDLLKYSTVLFNHDADRPIGRVVDADVDDVGLLVKVVLSKQEEDIWTKVKEEVINKFSIKGRAIEPKWVVDSEGEPVLKITTLELFEISLVSVPANSEAKTISWYVAKSFENVKSTNKEQDALSDTKQYDLGDTSETRPIFQLNLDSDSIVLSDENKFRKQLLKTGKWYHCRAEGGVLDITADAITKIVRNFKAKVLDKVTVPLTHTQNPAMNTGEVVELIATKEGLDAICEIKDESVAEKIKKGLIASISASIEPNYQNKETGVFVGPTLLHAALVKEPLIKGMREFVTLGDMYNERPIIQLEDENMTVEETLNSMVKALEDLSTRLEVLEKSKTEEKEADTDTKEDDTEKDTKKSEADDSKDDKKDTDEAGDKEKDDDGDTNDEGEKDTEKSEGDDEAKDEKDEADADEKKSDSAGDKDVADAEKERADKDAEELVKYETCIGKYVEAGKSLTDAHVLCKQEAQEGTSEGDTEEDSESVDKSDKTTQQKVDLADVAEGLYNKYLTAGKVLPRQKDAFVELVQTKGAIDLGDDNKVDVKGALIAFLENQPKALDFSEKGTDEPEVPEKPKGSSDKDPAEIPADAKAFYKDKLNLSDEDAETAWNEARKLHSAENEESTIF